ncbi:hypothetical protein SEVIR_5G435100v4 [Setaria viridis]|uniref:Uncharacterized protein n=2 Tax=Setaria TaxID=4554 RepID=A0A368REY3_SETIT|nr:hypothetical protein SETIT_5G429200v2 [Setaria italica]TKW18505.1 hypothetical protein SEVIR_5G435100v2 [Setaria viridis]
MADGSSVSGFLIDLYDRDPGVTIMAGASPDILKFEVTTVETYLANRNWEGLETYIEKFLKDVQVEFHSHSGLVYTLYKARIGNLILNKKFDESRTLFNEKVQTLIKMMISIYHLTWHKMFSTWRPV